MKIRNLSLSLLYISLKDRIFGNQKDAVVVLDFHAPNRVVANMHPV